MQQLTGLDLDTQITDAGLKDVAKLQKLTYLNLTIVAKLHPLNHRCGPQGSGQVAEAQGLDLMGTKITDAGLKEGVVAKLQKLTDDLKEVAKLQQLKTLGLSSSEITDAGLKEVSKLHNLVELALGWAKITDAGSKRWPSCAAQGAA